jgi:HK97 gp10 family phage protein
MTNLAEFLARLGRVELEAVHRRALEEAAQRIEAAVQSALSHPPGGDHDTPWLRSGELRNSIAHKADAEGATIGSTSMVALYQEVGTRNDPPRPFLAPVAAAIGEEVAEAIGSAVVETIRAAIRGKVISDVSK